MIDVSKWVTLGSVPRIKLSARTSTSTTEAREITDCIHSLVYTNKSGVGFSDSVMGFAFAPVPNHFSRATRVVDDASNASATFTKLVASGGKAIPFLLNSLSDKTGTNLLLVPRPMGRLIPEPQELVWNPYNKREKAILGPYLMPDTFTMSFMNSYMNGYRVTVGDLCFVALGQIVGRNYSAVQAQPSVSTASVNSPPHDHKLCSALRAVWTSSSPCQTLLDSLLIDYSTKGVPTNDHSLGGIEVASDFQVEAIIRLLYYYTEFAVPLIVKRLNSLMVYGVSATAAPREMTVAELDRYVLREERNEVSTVNFIKAVSWCKDIRIQRSLNHILQRSNDQEIIAATRES